MNAWVLFKQRPAKKMKAGIHSRHMLWLLIASLIHAGNGSCGELGAIELVPEIQTFQPMLEIDLGQQMTDEEMEHSRGKFLDINDMQSFSVEMHTLWKTSSGEDYHMGLSLMMDLSQDLISVDSDIHAYSSEPGGFTETMSAAEGFSVPVTSIDGGMQMIQVSGDDNVVNNKIVVEIIDMAGLDESTVDDAALTPVSASYMTDSGVATEFTIDENLIGYSVAIPGQGQVSQSLGGHGLQQQILLF